MNRRDAETMKALAKKIKKGRVTLVFGAKNEEFNNAVALKEYLERK